MKDMTRITSGSDRLDFFSSSISDVARAKTWPGRVGVLCRRLNAHRICLQEPGCHRFVLAANSHKTANNLEKSSPRLMQPCGTGARSALDRPQVCNDSRVFFTRPSCVCPPCRYHSAVQAPAKAASGHSRRQQTYSKTDSRSRCLRSMTCSIRE